MVYYQATDNVIVFVVIVPASATGARARHKAPGYKGNLVKNKKKLDIRRNQEERKTVRPELPEMPKKHAGGP